METITNPATGWLLASQAPAINSKPDTPPAISEARLPALT
jgi:hypothetical protein